MRGRAVELDDGSILAGSQHVYVPNQDIGFTPLQGSSNLYTTTMTLKEDAGHTNYLLDFSINGTITRIARPTAVVGSRYRLPARTAPATSTRWALRTVTALRRDTLVVCP